MSAETPRGQRRPGARRAPRVPTRKPPGGAERGRILESAEQIVAEQGLRALTVEEVCSQSGVSHAGFTRAFGSREELLLALHDELAARVRASMYRTYVAERSWLDGVRAAISELLATLEANIELARFILLYCAIDEGALPARRAAFFAGFAKALERNRPSLDPDAAEPPFGGQAMVGAVVSILHGRLMEDPVPPLRELTGPLTGLIAMPYLGAGVAKTELARSRPSPYSP